MAEFTFAPLTPSSFLDRSAAVFADRVAIVDGEHTLTYREMSDRCRRLTGALAAMGVGHEDRVAALCTNSHVMLELHHAVPMRGAALVSVNIRLSPPEMAEIIRHSGASLLVVTHEIRDRSKDIIISGGENIASVEVEQVLDSHPSVVESAVVGMPHERWGEVPVAFVTLRKDDIDADALTEYARERLARYKVPKRFEFCELPKTSTGKIQKNLLRGQAHEL